MKNSRFQAAVVAGIAAAAVSGMGAYAVRGRSSQCFAPSVYKGSGRRRSIALTFDDGPSPKTMHLLDLLDRQGVPATFFQCGLNIERHPHIARQVYSAGHEVGNHTYSHPQLCPRIGLRASWPTADQTYREFLRAQQVFQDIMGISPTLLRVPFGLKWFGLRRTQRDLGMLGVMWTVIGRDWILDATGITNRVLSRIKPGAIVCLHDGRDIQSNPDISPLLSAVPELILQLRDQGFSFETVTSLLQP